MSILRTLISGLITQEFSTFQFALRLTDNHRILLSARRTPSAALESNLNRLIHFCHIVINARSIPSLKLIYIFRSSKTKLKKRNNSVVYSVWLLRYTVGLRLPVCVCFYKIHKYVASSRHQLIRRLNNLNRFVVGHRFRSLFVSKCVYFE